MAGIAGPQASPKGLWHGFEGAAVQADVPLSLVQRWLGQADLATTAIYVDAVGIEERVLVALAASFTHCLREALQYSLARNKG